MKAEPYRIALTVGGRLVLQVSNNCYQVGFIMKLYEKHCTFCAVLDKIFLIFPPFYIQNVHVEIRIVREILTLKN